MRIYLVCSTADNWMMGGYGQSLLAAEEKRLLVSFVEFMKKPDQRFIVDEMTDAPYQPNVVSTQLQAEQGLSPLFNVA